MKKTTAIGLAAAAAVVLLMVILASTPEARTEVHRWYGLVTDREWTRAAVESFGWVAPLVFIGIQIAQVIAAPVPGEATGFIGGYLFGILPGFIYSTIGLAIGSLINFGIGRLLGEKFEGHGRLGRQPVLPGRKHAQQPHHAADQHGAAPVPPARPGKIGGFAAGYRLQASGFKKRGSREIPPILFFSFQPCFPES